MNMKMALLLKIFPLKFLPLSFFAVLWVKWIQVLKIMMFTKFLIYLIRISTFFVLWFEIFAYLPKALIEDQFVVWILWHFVHTRVGLGRVRGMPTQATWAQGDYVKISFEIDQNFPSTEMISFVFIDIS